MTRTVQLREIATDADRAAVLDLRMAPGQARFVSSVAESLEEAAAYPQACPRAWSINDGAEVVGFVMISDGIPAATLADDPELVGPYFLWKLLIDVDRQRRGYGRATLDAIVEYVRRAGGTVLYVSYAEGEGTPLPFYLGYGFERTGRIADGEEVLALDVAGAQARRSAGARVVDPLC